jgi:hypothetical protein
MESTIGLYKTELIDRHPRTWTGPAEVETATADWVHWFNTERLHSSINYLPPITYEQQYRQIRAAPKPGKLAKPRPPAEPGRFIYPPQLNEQGLPAALHAAVLRIPQPVTLRCEHLGRYPRKSNPPCTSAAWKGCRTPSNASAPTPTSPSPCTTPTTGRARARARAHLRPPRPRHRMPARNPAHRPRPAQHQRPHRRHRRHPHYPHPPRRPPPRTHTDMKTRARDAGCGDRQDSEDPVVLHGTTLGSFRSWRRTEPSRRRTGWW